jgi:alpha-L-fucosidase
VRVGPHKDIVGTWAAVARKYGLPFGVSNHSSHAWHWLQVAYGHDFEGPLKGVPYDGWLTKADGKGQWWDGLDPQDLYAQNVVTQKIPLPEDPTKIINVPSAAYCEKFYNRVLDLVNKYHPDLLYFDDSVLPLYPASDVGLKIAAHFYNSNALWHNGRNQGVLLGKDLNDVEKQCMVWDVERGTSPKIEPIPWESETCIGNWHYERALYDNHGYKTSSTVIHTLADVVSKNGTFLLNIPVRADGTIDDQEVAIVQAIGKWMKVNGEAIYATRPWKVCGEGPSIDHPADLARQGFNESKIKLGVDDIRFTTKGNALYAIVLGWPTQPVTIKSFGKKAGLLDGSIASIKLVGSDEKIAWTQADDAVTIQAPKQKLFDEATVFECTLKQ